MLTLACDIQDSTHASLAFASCPTHGVLHAAGVSTKDALHNVDVGHLATAFGPKAFGATNIHAATAQCSLDASILISSVSTFWCRPGQGCYAAANAFLDAHAHASRGAHGQSCLSLSLPGVEGMGMGAALNVRRSIQMSLDEYDASIAFMLMANFATVTNAILPSSLERFLQGTPEAQNPLFSNVAELNTTDFKSASKTPFALSSCRLEGRLSAAWTVKLIKTLKDGMPAMLELVGVRLEADPMLSPLMQGRRAPLVVSCRGELSGDGAMLLLGMATFALGDTTTVLDVSHAGIASLSRRASRLDVRPSKYSAAEAVLNGWLDEVHSSPAAVTEVVRIVNRFAHIPADLLSACKTRLPAPLAEAAVIAMGTLHQSRTRPPGPRLVRVTIDERNASTAIELCDEKRSNTISHELGEDVALAAATLRRNGAVQSISLHGKGLHFSVGVNPYNYCSDSQSPLAASALACEQLLDGFLQLRGLSVPFVCAVHGKLIGAALAACLNADYIVAHVDTTFCHGNIVRGVCPLGMLSQTLVRAVGCNRALAMYMTNETLTSSSALKSGLISELCTDGVRATQLRGIGLASYLAEHTAYGVALIKRRDPLDQRRIACEALGHARCLAANGGRYADSPLPKSTDEVPTGFVPMISGPTGDSTQSSIVQPVHHVEVAVALTQEVLAQMLQWPEAGLLVVRGAAETENFSLGGNPSPSRLRSGDFLHDVPAFARLLAHLQRRSGPSVVICKGATRGFGMLFPCMGTCVVADAEATFGFPEVRRGVLPGVVSVAATERLSPAVCEQLFCTGDAFDATTAKRFGLVDLLCSSREGEIKINELVVQFVEMVKVSTQAKTTFPKGVAISIDSTRRVACLCVDTTCMELSCNALHSMSHCDQIDLLRVLVINVEGNLAASAAEAKDAPPAFASRLEIAIKHLNRMGVLVLCSVRGEMTAAQVHFCAHAHYRIFHSHASISTKRLPLRLLQKTMRWDAAQLLLQSDRITAALALELGIASEVVDARDGDVEERSLRLAQWLVGQPRMGILQMLNVTFLTAPSDTSRSDEWRAQFADDRAKEVSQVSSVLSCTILAWQPCFFFLNLFLLRLYAPGRSTAVQMKSLPMASRSSVHCAITFSKRTAVRQLKS